MTRGLRHADVRSSIHRRVHGIGENEPSMRALMPQAVIGTAGESKVRQ